MSAPNNMFVIRDDEDEIYDYSDPTLAGEHFFESRNSSQYAKKQRSTEKQHRSAENTSVSTKAPSDANDELSSQFSMDELESDGDYKACNNKMSGAKKQFSVDDDKIIFSEGSHSMGMMANARRAFRNMLLLAISFGIFVVFCLPYCGMQSTSDAMLGIDSPEDVESDEPSHGSKHKSKHHFAAEDYLPSLSNLNFFAGEQAVEEKPQSVGFLAKIKNAVLPVASEPAVKTTVVTQQEIDEWMPHYMSFVHHSETLGDQATTPSEVHEHAKKGNCGALVGVILGVCCCLPFSCYICYLGCMMGFQGTYECRVFCCDDSVRDFWQTMGTAAITAHNYDEWMANLSVSQCIMVKCCMNTCGSLSSIPGFVGVGQAIVQTANLWQAGSAVSAAMQTTAGKSNGPASKANTTFGKIIATESFIMVGAIQMEKLSKIR